MPLSFFDERCGSMKPIIGVMPLWDDAKESIWMLPGYMDGIYKAGGLPIIFPFTADETDLENLINMCNGFLFTGGQDVSPGLYNERPMDSSVKSCPKRDDMELIVLKKALEKDKPVLGICRGIQFINAALGGSLYQDIPSQHPSDLEHNQSAPFHKPVHEVEIMEDTPLYNCLGIKQLAVNSYHHQGVYRVAEELTVMAVASDGLVEALYRPQSSFLWAVQWHPEFSFHTDNNSRKLFAAFINAAL